MVKDKKVRGYLPCDQVRQETFREVDDREVGVEDGTIGGGFDSGTPSTCPVYTTSVCSSQCKWVKVNVPPEAATAVVSRKGLL